MTLEQYFVVLYQYFVRIPDVEIQKGKTKRLELIPINKFNNVWDMFKIRDLIVQTVNKDYDNCLSLYRRGQLLKDWEEYVYESR